MRNVPLIQPEVNPTTIPKPRHPQPSLRQPSLEADPCDRPALHAWRGKHVVAIAFAISEMGPLQLGGWTLSQNLGWAIPTVSSPPLFLSSLCVPR